MSTTSTETELATTETSATPRTYKLNPWVFGISAGIIAIALAFALIIPEAFNEFVGQVNTTVANTIGWYYVAIVTGFVIFALVIAFSKLGNIKLGKDDEKPKYSVLTWFSMLFAAGMGIGLVFWGAAEPLSHLASPPPGFEAAAIEEQARRAMTQTFLHWGVHAWAIYVVVGLAVAYSCHRKGRPISLRWALEPILGKHTDTWVGNVIDIAAVVGTLFGVATSLGFGVNQISAGLSFLGVLDPTTLWKVVIVAVITLFATISVVSGLDKGIRILSNVNLSMAGLFLITILILGPTLFIFRDLVASTGSYIQNFISMSFQTFPFHGEAGEGWLGGWTTYYWGWWISWSPFVGVFIARISRGRTVRQFITGVLLVPTAVTILWFSVIGGSAIYQELFAGGGLIVDGAVDNDTALFALLGTLPAAQLLSGVVLILVVIFFVTSSDSGSFVVDMLCHSGNPNPPVWSRTFWALMEGAIAASLLSVSALAGGSDESGMEALQAMTIIAAAPFSIAMIGMCVATFKALRTDHRQYEHANNELVRRELLREATAHTVDTTAIAQASPDEPADFVLVPKDELESEIADPDPSAVENLPK